MPSTEAVCFDLDSTLCESDQSDEEIHRETFARAGVEPFFSPADVRAVDMDDVPTADTQVEFYRNLYRTTLDGMDADPDPAESVLTDLAEATVEVVDPTAVSFRDGARVALDHARDRYEVGLITNGGRETQTAKLETLGITDAFDTRVFCDREAGVEPKPDVEPFEIALADLSADPDETLYVGDSLSADVAGAHAAGLRSVWVPPNRPHDEVPSDPDPEPTHWLDSPAALPDVL